VASENVILIKPTVDASNKQLHYKNDFRYAGKNFEQYLSQNDNYDLKGFRPSHLGKHSKSVKSIKLNIKDVNVIEPDFKRNMYGECGRLEDLPDYRKAKKLEQFKKAKVIANTKRAENFEKELKLLEEKPDLFK